MKKVIDIKQVIKDKVEITKNTAFAKSLLSDEDFESIWEADEITFRRMFVSLFLETSRQLQIMKNLIWDLEAFAGFALPKAIFENCGPWLKNTEIPYTTEKRARILERLGFDLNKLIDEYTGKKRLPEDTWPEDIEAILNKKDQ